MEGHCFMGVRSTEALFAQPFCNLSNIGLCSGLIKTVSVGRRRLSADFQLLFRLIEGSIFITFLAIFITLLALAHMTLKDIIVCILALSPTGWGLLLIAQALKPLIVKAQLWGSLRALARGYEIIMGLLLFTPVAFLACMVSFCFRVPNKNALQPGIQQRFADFLYSWWTQKGTLLQPQGVNTTTSTYTRKSM